MNDKNSKNDNQDSAVTPLQGFDAVASFIRQYLVCDDHQLTIFTLWIANTWCFFSFRTAPYLDIRSPEPQSGKSLCLQLLNELSSPALLVAGPDPQTLRHRLLNGRSKDQIQNQEKCARVSFPLLLDDCHQTFNWSERQTLLSLLNCGSDLNSLYAWGSKDYFVFGPKAFAGNAPLPQSLASRCIPIVLRRRKASDPVQRFFADDVSNLTTSMRHWIDSWARDNYSRFEEARKKPVQFPPALTPRQQLCAEPLLRIANFMAVHGQPKPALLLLRYSDSPSVPSRSNCCAMCARSSSRTTNRNNCRRATCSLFCATLKTGPGVSGAASQDSGSPLCSIPLVFLARHQSG